MTFAEVIGMTELNDGKPRRIRNCKVCMQLGESCLTCRQLRLWPPGFHQLYTLLLHAAFTGGLIVWHGTLGLNV